MAITRDTCGRPSGLSWKKLTVGRHGALEDVLKVTDHAMERARNLEEKALMFTTEGKRLLVDDVWESSFNGSTGSYALPECYGYPRDGGVVKTQKEPGRAAGGHGGV